MTLGRANRESYKEDEGFNLAELVVALGLLTVLIVVVIGIFTGALRGGQKSADHTSASVLADTVLLQRVQRVYDGLEPGLTKDHLFSNSGGGSLKGTERLSQTDFHYELRYLPVETPSGDPIGDGLEDNRLVKVDAVVWWWNEDSEDVRAGMGHLRVHLSRIFHEGAELR